MRYKEFLTEQSILNTDVTIKGTDITIPKGTEISVISSGEEEVVAEIKIKGKTYKITVSKDNIGGDEEEEKRGETNEARVRISSKIIREVTKKIENIFDRTISLGNVIRFDYKGFDITITVDAIKVEE